MLGNRGVFQNDVSLEMSGIRPFPLIEASLDSHFTSHFVDNSGHVSRLTLPVDFPEDLIDEIISIFKEDDVTSTN